MNYDSKMQALYHEVELPLLPILAHMEMRGALVSTEEINRLNDLYEVEKQKLPIELEPYIDNWETINLQSYEEVSILLFETLKLEPPRIRGKLPLTEKGFISTNTKNVLDEMEHHPVLSTVRAHRMFAKLQGYCKTLSKPHPYSGRVHTNFNQAKVKTGRLSCLDPSSLLLTANGIRTIGEVLVGDRVWDGSEYTAVLAKEKTLHDRLYTITTHGGTRLQCSYNHKIATNRGWLNAEDVSLGDKVLSSAPNPSLSIDDLTPDLKWEFFGLVAADGHVDRAIKGRPYITILAYDPEVADLKDYIANFVKNEYDANAYKTYYTHKYCSIKLGRELERHRLDSLHHLIEVPEYLYTAPLNEVSSFLRGYFEGDGSVDIRGGGDINAISTSRNLLIGIRHLLLRLGVKSWIIKDNKKKALESHRDTFFIRILDTVKFIQLIGFLSNKKKEKCKQISSDREDTNRLHTAITVDSWIDRTKLYDLIPIITDKNTKSALRSVQHRNAQSITRALLNRIHSADVSADHIFNRFSREIRNTHLEDTVLDVQISEGEYILVDIETESNRYIADCVLVHNSSSPLNFQNIPSRTDYGKLLRGAFVAPPGMVIWRTDYDQMELRAETGLSRDPVKMAIYARGGDIHADVSRMIYGHLPDFEDKLDFYRKITKCYHPDTEVLTHKGWKRILDLKEGEEVVQAIPVDGVNATLEWTKPTAVFSKHHESKKLVYLENEGIDIGVTPDHRMLWFAQKTDKSRVVTPYEMNKTGKWLHAGSLEGDLSIDERMLRLAVATQADGGYNGGRIKFGFSKVRKIERMKSLLHADEFSLKIWPNGEHKDTTWFILSRELSDDLKTLLDGKKLPWWWLNLTKELRQVVIDESVYWDSTKRKENRASYYLSTLQQNIDVLQAIAATTNRKSSTSQSTESCMSLSIKDHNFSWAGTAKIREESFTDEVACLSVPSTFVLIRYRGKTLICGQSGNFLYQYRGGPKKASITMDIPYKEAVDFLWRQKNLYKGSEAFFAEYCGIMLEKGYAETILGRRRNLPGITALQKWAAEEAQRKGYSLLIQGSCADFMKRTMVRIRQRMDQANLKSNFIIQVHDELVWEVIPEETEILYEIVMETFSDIPELPIDMPTSIEIGPNWLNTTEVESISHALEVTNESLA